jgi:hypothetical protein
VFSKVDWSCIFFGGDAAALLAVTLKARARAADLGAEVLRTVAESADDDAEAAARAACILSRGAWAVISARERSCCSPPNLVLPNLFFFAKNVGCLFPVTIESAVGTRGQVVEEWRGRA